MKHLVKIVGLCLASMLVMGMAITATASATPHWLDCAEGSGSTKYSTSQCTTAESGGKWQWNEVTGTEKTVTKGSLLLKDLDSPLGVSEVECWGEAAGTVGPGAFDLTTSVTVNAKNCRAIKGCEKVESIEAVDLPWQTEVTEPKVGEYVDLLNGDGKGEPGYKVVCKEVLNFTDTCTNSGTESLLLENKNTGGVLLVLATFQKLRKGICSASTLSSKESGEVSGSLAVLLESGGGLRLA